MQLLKDIIYRAGIEEVNGSTDVAVKSIAFDSRKVKKGSLFIATTGTKVDGHQFIGEVIEKGAIAIVCERIPAEIKKGILSEGQKAYAAFGNKSLVHQQLEVRPINAIAHELSLFANAIKNKKQAAVSLDEAYQTMKIADEILAIIKKNNS